MAGNDINLAKGIYVTEPAIGDNNLFMCCFWHSLIIFLVAFGAIGGFLSAFSIEYSVLPVVVVFLAASFYFSFMYSTRKLYLRDAGYIAFFAVFMASIYYLRNYANSGFYTIINTVLQRAQSFFNLAGMREYDTKVYNGYVAVAVAVIFVGIVLIIILNILLSNFMSIIWSVIITFPLLIIPMYMKLSPSPVYIICFAAGYGIVLAFRANGHYRLFNNKSIVRHKNKPALAYTVDKKIFSQIIITVAAVIGCIVIFAEMLVPSAVFESYFSNDRLRDKTSDAMGNFILLGFSGLFNRYNATGGVNGGKLGGIASVRPDYETDLVVTYTPYSGEGVYLRAYTGGRYGGNQWEEADVVSEPCKETEFLKSQDNKYYAYGKMDIENVGANILYMYYPNYTDMQASSIEGNYGLESFDKGLLLKQHAIYEYYPKLVWDAAQGNMKPSDIDVSELDPVYLEVPDKNKDVIAKECEKIGLNSDMTENQIIDEVVKYFQENIPYTLRPGATPDNSDFVNYFLTKNRKGYCTHFASAAALIYRQMGIPARYVEGYAFSYENVLASEENQYMEYGDFYSGLNLLGETAVVDVEVTDAMAHAWVEVYIDGFGWKIVEVTPSGSEDGEMGDFWSVFSNMFGGQNEGEAYEDQGGFGGLNPGKYIWILYLFAVIAIIPAVVMLSGRLVTQGRRYRRLHQKDLRERVIAVYADICDRIRRYHPDFNTLASHREQLEYIRRLSGTVFDADERAEQLELISFGGGQVDAETLNELLGWLKTIKIRGKGKNGKNIIRACEGCSQRLQ